MTDLQFPETTHICYPKDIVWVEEKDWANEAVLVYFITEEGCGYIQIVFSSMSVNVITQASVKYWSKDVNKFSTKTGKSSALVISEDKRSCSAIDTSFTALETDHFHYKIKSSFDEKIQFDLDFTSTCDYAYQTDKIPFDPTNIKNGYCIHRFIPTGRVAGTAIVEGKTIQINGTALYSHAVQQNPQYCKRWNLFTMNNGKDGLMLLEFVSKNAKVSKSGLVLDNKLVAVSTDCEVKEISNEKDPDTKYDVPKEMQYIVKGKTIEGGKPFTATVTMKPSNMVAKLDCLSFLPFLIRKFVQTFISKPFIYQWLDQGEVKLEIEGEAPRTISGTVFQETSFVSK